MNHLDLIDKIRKLDVWSAEKMSPESMAVLTNKFDESLVKDVIYVGRTNAEQLRIIKAIMQNYKQWMQSHDSLWSTIDGNTPEYMNELLLDIEIGEVLSADGNGFLTPAPLAKDIVKKEEVGKIKVEDASDVSSMNTQIKELIEATKKIEELKADNQRLQENNKTLQQERDYFEGEYQYLEGIRSDWLEKEHKQQEEIEKLKLYIQQNEKEQPFQFEIPEDTMDSMQLKLRIEVLNRIMAKAGVDLTTITEKRIMTHMVTLYNFLLGQGTTRILKENIGKVVYTKKPKGTDEKVKELNMLLQKLDDDFIINL